MSAVEAKIWLAGCGCEDVTEGMPDPRPSPKVGELLLPLFLPSQVKMEHPHESLLGPKVEPCTVLQPVTVVSSSAPVDSLSTAPLGSVHGVNDNVPDIPLPETEQTATSHQVFPTVTPTQYEPATLHAGTVDPALHIHAPVADKPVVAAAHAPAVEANNADAHVLPVGHNVHPAEQAAAVHDAPPELVDAQVKKVQAAEREHRGLPEKGHLVPGIADDKLFALMRRFNAVSNNSFLHPVAPARLTAPPSQTVTHVLSPPTKLPPGEPDLRPTSLPTVPFQSDVLKSNLERVYSTAGVWSIYFAREMSRLMSWDEAHRQRTGAWCASYIVAWYFALVIPAICMLCVSVSRLLTSLASR